MPTIIFDVLQGMGLVSLLTCALLYVLSIKQRMDCQAFKKLVFERMWGHAITKHHTFNDIEFR